MLLPLSRAPPELWGFSKHANKRSIFSTGSWPAIETQASPLQQQPQYCARTFSAKIAPVFGHSRPEQTGRVSDCGNRPPDPLQCPGKDFVSVRRWAREQKRSGRQTGSRQRLLHRRRQGRFQTVAKFDHRPVATRRRPGRDADNDRSRTNLQARRRIAASNTVGPDGFVMSPPCTDPRSDARGLQRTSQGQVTDAA